MRLRSGPEAQVLRASVALLWLGGKTSAEIASACAISRGYGGNIVYVLRAEGLEMPRRKPGRRPGVRAASRPRREPRPAEPRRERIAVDRHSPDRGDILDAWRDGVQARDIALLTRRSLWSVKEIVRRARLAGDTRATRHPRWPKPSVVMRPAA